MTHAPVPSPLLPALPPFAAAGPHRRISCLPWRAAAPPLLAAPVPPPTCRGDVHNFTHPRQTTHTGMAVSTHTKAACKQLALQFSNNNLPAQALLPPAPLHSPAALSGVFWRLLVVIILHAAAWGCSGTDVCVHIYTTAQCREWGRCGGVWRSRANGNTVGLLLLVSTCATA